MRLIEGSKVPKFELLDVKGNLHTNETMLGKKYMISFYRYAS